MVVLLQEIDTVDDLYKKGILRASENPLYPPQAAVLDRVSL